MIQYSLRCPQHLPLLRCALGARCSSARHSDCAGPSSWRPRQRLSSCCDCCGHPARNHASSGACQAIACCPGFDWTGWPSSALPRLLACCWGLVVYLAAFAVSFASITRWGWLAAGWRRCRVAVATHWLLMDHYYFSASVQTTWAVAGYFNCY